MSVTEVAFATGFGSLASFRRQFTRLTGARPSGYRHTFKGLDPTSPERPSPRTAAGQ